MTTTEKDYTELMKSEVSKMSFRAQRILERYLDSGDDEELCTLQGEDLTSACAILRLELERR